MSLRLEVPLLRLAGNWDLESQVPFTTWWTRALGTAQWLLAPPLRPTLSSTEIDISLFGTGEASLEMMKNGKLGVVMLWKYTYKYITSHCIVSHSLPFHWIAFPSNYVTLRLSIYIYIITHTHIQLICQNKWHTFLYMTKQYKTNKNKHLKI